MRAFLMTLAFVLIASSVGVAGAADKIVGTWVGQVDEPDESCPAKMILTSAHEGTITYGGPGEECTATLKGSKYRATYTFFETIIDPMPDCYSAGAFAVFVLGDAMTYRWCNTPVLRDGKKVCPEWSLCARLLSSGEDH